MCDTKSVLVSKPYSPSWLNGSVIELYHPSTELKSLFLIEKSIRDGSISFCSIEKPYERLKVSPNGKVSWSSSIGKFSSFQVIVVDSEMDSQEKDWVAFRLCANQNLSNCDSTLGWYLGMKSQSQLDNSRSFCEKNFQGNCGISESSLFHVKEKIRQATLTLSNSDQLNENFMDGLSSSELDLFMEQGFLKLRDVVPMTYINAVLRRINHELGKPGAMTCGGVEGDGKLEGGISNCKEIMDLFNCTRVRKIAESIIGYNCIQEPRGAQLALRFPEMGEPQEPTGVVWHTDGMRQGKLNPFSLLVGVTLSDVPTTQSGNFIVFPGSHYVLHELLLPDGKLKDCDVLCKGHRDAWGDGTLPDMGKPMQLIASRGDIVLAHPKLAHRGGPNYSPNIRYQVYFRLKHKNHAQLQDQLVHDLWADLQGCHSHPSSSVQNDQKVEIQK